MRKKFDLSQMTFQAIAEGEEAASCLIPIPGTHKVELEVRCDEIVTIHVVTEDGEFIPLDSGTIVRWSGKLEGVSSVQIVAPTSFWYRCHVSPRWYEFNDGIPLKVELVSTEKDVLKAMIEERLNAYKHAMKMERQMTEEEWEEAVLDIAAGDLEFENHPDEFGLGYEERLKEFTQRTAEPSNPEGVPTPPPAEPPAPSGIQTPPAGPNSSST